VHENVLDGLGLGALGDVARGAVSGGHEQFSAVGGVVAPRLAQNAPEGRPPEADANLLGDLHVAPRYAGGV
jgi:hypothetical protein